MPICRNSPDRSFLAIDLNGQPGKNSSLPTVSLEKKQLGKIEGQWESTSSFSRAKAYIVSPEDPLLGSEASISGSARQPETKLYATCIASMMPSEKGAR